VKELKDDTDLLAAKPREPLFVEAGDFGAVEPDAARRGRVEARDEAEQRGLAAAGRTSDGDRAAVGDFE
jgi:hypothetical protein